MATETNSRRALWVLVPLALALLAFVLLRGRASEPQAGDQGGDEAGALEPSASANEGLAKGFHSPDPATAPKASISGTISDPEGRPIAGAQVCATPSQAALRGIRVPERPCTISTQDGYYRLDGLWPVPSRVDASAAQRQPRHWLEQIDGRWEAQVTLRAGTTVEHIDIVLPPGGVLVRGVIKDISGGEIEGVQVAVSPHFWTGSRQRGTAVTRTDAEGSFEAWVAPGEIWIGATIEGYAMGSTEAVAPGEFIELFLTPESVLVGQVVHAQTGEPVSGATVSSGGGYSSIGSGHGEARTDAEGRFRIDSLAPGTFKPSVKADDLRGEATDQVHLGLGETSETIVIRAHPAAYIEGRVVIAGRGEPQPCPKGQVVLEQDHQRNTWTDLEPDGVARFRGVLPGSYRIRVECNDTLAEENYPELVVGEGNLVGLTWEVREALSIRGVVVDSSGAPLDEIPVFARAIQDEDAPGDGRSRKTTDRATTNPDGDFELAGLLPGRYEILAGSSWRGRAGPREPVTVELDSGADVNDVRIEMPATGVIRGVVVDGKGNPVSGAGVEAESTERRGTTQGRTDDAGRFELTEVLVGESRVTANSGAMWQSQAMRAPGTNDDDIQGELAVVSADGVTEVRLVVESRDGVIRGRVVDEGQGAVADAFIEVERIPDKAGGNAARARQQLRWSWDRKPVLTDPDGRFEVGELPDGRFLVRAHRRGGGEAIVEDVELGSEVELVIESPGEIAGTISVPGGAPPERFQISVHDPEQGQFARDSFLRTAGAWRLTNISAGHYELTVTSSAGNAQTEFDLDPGQILEGIELELAPLIEVRGRVVDLETREPVLGATVSIRSHAGGSSADDPEHGNVSDADGRFVLREVPTGQVFVSIRVRAGGGDKGDHGGGWFNREIATTPLEQDIGELELVARRLGTGERGGDLGFTTQSSEPGEKPEDARQIVALIRPGGPAVDTGLAVGDEILTVDGHTVSGVDSTRWWALVAASPGTKLSLGLSGGKTIELVLGEPQ